MNLGGQVLINEEKSLPLKIQFVRLPKSLETAKKKKSPYAPPTTQPWKSDYVAYTSL